MRFPFEPIRFMLNAPWQAALVAVVALCGTMTPAGAEESLDKPEGGNQQRADQRPEYIRLLEAASVNGDQPVASFDRPFFRYADSARIIADGAIWAWGGEGRPQAMAKCWINRSGTRTCAFSLTSDERVVVRGPQSKVWEPQSTQVEATKLAGGPPPDPKAAVRLRQIKEQARRFTAHEFWNPDNARYELRLLPQPIHRYQDAGKQVEDGAIFLLAYDNNPQILLFLEILTPEQGKERWQYLLARVSSADLRVCLDGKEVWAQARTPGIMGKPTDFYWHMVTAPPSDP
jgi:hypothetical protein